MLLPLTAVWLLSWIDGRSTSALLATDNYVLNIPVTGFGLCRRLAQAQSGVLQRMPQK